MFFRRVLLKHPFDKNGGTLFLGQTVGDKQQKFCFYLYFLVDYLQ